MRAARNHNGAVVDFLVSSKAKVHLADKVGDTALHIAIRARSKGWFALGQVQLTYLAICLVFRDKYSYAQRFTNVTHTPPLPRDWSCGHQSDTGSKLALKGWSRDEARSSLPRTLLLKVGWVRNCFRPKQHMGNPSH